MTKIDVVRVMTTQSSLSPQQEEQEFSPGVVRRWGAVGTLVEYSNSHGLCFGVQHMDGVTGYYLADELQLINPEGSELGDLREVVTMQRDQIELLKRQNEELRGNLANELPFDFKQKGQYGTWVFAGWAFTRSPVTGIWSSYQWFDSSWKVASVAGSLPLGSLVMRHEPALSIDDLNSCYPKGAYGGPGA